MLRRGAGVLPGREIAARRPLAPGRRLSPDAGSLRDRSVGIAGLGRIGKAIARRLEAFGLTVSYYGRSPQEDVDYRFYSDLVAMARDVDTLIVVTPGGPGTRT